MLRARFGRRDFRPRAQLPPSAELATRGTKLKAPSYVLVAVAAAAAANSAGAAKTSIIHRSQWSAQVQNLSLYLEREREEQN